MKHSKTWCLSCSQHTASKRKRGKKAKGFHMESQGNTAKNSPFSTHLVTLRAISSFSTVPLTAQITCIWSPQWVSTEETPEHPTAILLDQWLPCNTSTPILWLEQKVLKIGSPEVRFATAGWVPGVSGSVLTLPG